MIGTIVAWAVGILVVAIIIGGILAGRRRRTSTVTGMYTSPDPDPDVARKVDAQLAEMQTHEATRLGPGMYQG